jgi:hypothetical protein
MSAVVYEQVVVAVELQKVETKHESLQDGMRLEGDDAVQVPLVLRLQHSAVYLPVLERQEVVLTQRRHVVWNKKHSASKLVSGSLITTTCMRLDKTLCRVAL